MNLKIVDIPLPFVTLPLVTRKGSALKGQRRGGTWDVNIYE